MSATLTHGGLQGVTDRSGLLKQLETAGPRLLRLSATAFRLLKHAVLKCSEGDFQKGRICGFWEQPRSVAFDLGISPRVLNEAERELERKGFIARTWTLHAPRRGARENGRIRFLAGINLAPLIDGFVERVLRPIEVAQLEHRARAILSQEIGEVWQAIHRIGGAGAQAKAQAILPGGRKSRIADVERLTGLKADLEALLAAIMAEPGAQETSDRSEEISAPNILPKDSSKPSSAGSAGEPQAITPAQALRLASTDYRALVGGTTWPSLITASAKACAWHGISQRQWGDACQRIGRERAALCVLAIDRTARLPGSHRYRSRSPRACLWGMVRRAREGGFDPTRLLRGVQGVEEAPASAEPEPAWERGAAPPASAKTLGGALPGILVEIEARRKMTEHQS